MATQGRLDGRRALVYGAGRGIGQAIAKRLAREGARVACGNRTLANAEATAAAIRAAGGDALAVEVDVTKRASADRGVEQAAEWLGGIDAFVQAAGVIGSVPFLDLEDEEWHRILNTNLHGTFYSCRAVARHMVGRRTRGAIVVVTSQLAQVATPNRTAYHASKGALSMLVKSMALELVTHGVRVNALAPGVTATDMAMSRLGKDAEAMRRTLERIPMGRLAKPEEMSGAAAFLLSEDASYVTGTTLFVDGGYLAV